MFFSVHLFPPASIRDERPNTLIRAGVHTCLKGHTDLKYTKYLPKQARTNMHTHTHTETHTDRARRAPGDSFFSASISTGLITGPKRNIKMASNGPERFGSLVKTKQHFQGKQN